MTKGPVTWHPGMVGGGNPTDAYYHEILLETAPDKQRRKSPKVEALEDERTQPADKGKAR